jgi:hypothetical protein
MKTVLIVLGAITALIVLPFVAIPLLIAGGLGMGIAAIVGSAAVLAVPFAIGVAVLGVVGLALRLVFGLVGIVFSVIGAIIGGLLSLLLLPLMLLPVLLPALLVGGIVWWVVRARRPSPQVLPAPAAV